MRPDRRTVLAAAGALTAIAATAKAADGQGSLTLFDPAEPTARSFAESRGGKKIAIAGDRIRLARRLFANAPDRLTVIGRHADVLLLTEAAREEGYRALAMEPFPTVDGGLFIWTAQRRA